jgi:hypothetical protein
MQSATELASTFSRLIMGPCNTCSQGTEEGNRNKRMRTSSPRVNVYGRVSTYSPQEFTVWYCENSNTLHVSDCVDFWIRIPFGNLGCIIGSIDQMGMVAGRTLQKRKEDKESSFPFCDFIRDEQEAAADKTVRACDKPNEPMFVVAEILPDGYMRIESPRVPPFHLSLHFDPLAPFLSRRNDVDVLTVESMPSLPCVDAILAARSSDNLRYAIAANEDYRSPTVDQLGSFLADCSMLGALAILETAFYPDLWALLEKSTHPDAERARRRLQRDTFAACVLRQGSEGVLSTPIDAELVRRIVAMSEGERDAPEAQQQ